MTAQTFTFQAEIKQLLDILIHSLYTEQDIFLRELISNASDALNRVQFEMLTNHDVTSPDAELAIRIQFDEEAKTLTISDTGIGMSQEELIRNLGTIARSGAKAFIEALKDNQDGSTKAHDVIGQFGVGFYSVFMVADQVRVVSKSYQPDEPAYAWVSDGSNEYVIEPAERTERGTDIIISLKEDAQDFLQSYKINQIIRTHSNYIAFPIYVGDSEEPTNKQTAIWRKSPKEVEAKEYNDFYKMMTMDFTDPTHHLHLNIDTPVQFYALLYFPASAEQTMFSLRKEPGLQLYARKVLIQDYNKDILPEYLQFVQGVVDSEDLPLNVSRESVKLNRVMVNLGNIITKRVLNDLKRMVDKDREKYLKIFQTFSRFIKQGAYVDHENSDTLKELLLFQTTHDDVIDNYYSLKEYVERFADNQQDIYYIIADDWHSARRSPHLDAFRKRGIEVLYFTEPVDVAMLMGLSEYQGHKLRSVDESDIDLSDIGTLAEEEEQAEAVPQDTFSAVIDRFKAILGERVQDVRESKSLTSNPARLISDEGGTQRNLFRINRLIEREYQLPVKVLELNPRHALLHNLSTMMNHGDPKVVDAVVEQLFENALLQDGIHPDPAAMTERITLLMQAATGTAVSDLDFDAVPKLDAPVAPTQSGMPDLSSLGLDGLDMEGLDLEDFSFQNADDDGEDIVEADFSDVEKKDDHPEA
jgi:molecular chaperone HtpG